MATSSKGQSPKTATGDGPRADESPAAAEAAPAESTPRPEAQAGAPGQPPSGAPEPADAATASEHQAKRQGGPPGTKAAAPQRRAGPPGTKAAAPKRQSGPPGTKAATPKRQGGPPGTKAAAPQHQSGPPGTKAAAPKRRGGPPGTKGAAPKSQTHPAPAKTAPASAKAHPPGAKAPASKPAAGPPGTQSQPTTAKPQAPRSGGPRAQIAQLRQVLVADSEAHWREYLEEVAARQSQEDEEERSEVSPPELGDWVCLEGVDYTRQVEVRGMQVVFHDDAHRQPWAVLIDHQFSALIELGSQVEASFGFDRSTTWDLVGRVAGFDFVFDDLAFRSRKVPTARVNALFRPGQFVVFHHPKQGPMVPGLEAAQDKLGAIHARLAIPNAKEPSELLDTFLTIIETGNLPRFRELSMPSADARMLRRRFEVFVKVLDACGGRVAFDRYDEDRSPKSPGPDGEVKMFVERTNADGTTTSRPLTFVKVDGRWRLKAGMI